jgi:hypothetical protein
VVLRVKTELPEKLEAMFARKPEMTAAMNAMATLGALTIDSGQIFVGSRLTIYEDAENLLKLLNRMEWAPQDLAPHFGAWCPGRVGMNLAYVSFLPNALYPIKGMATNVSLWAWYRAR